MFRRAFLTLLGLAPVAAVASPTFVAPFQILADANAYASFPPRFPSPETGVFTAAARQIAELYGDKWPKGFSMAVDSLTDNILITNGRPPPYDLGFAITRNIVVEGRHLAQVGPSLKRLLELTEAEATLPGLPGRIDGSVKGFGGEH
jgi:hypothetical protein